MRKWFLSLALLPSLALGQVSVKQPFHLLWDYDVVANPIDRFEIQYDLGVYTSVGIPPVTAGTYSLLGNSTLAGSHSAVVRACNTLGCSSDSNTVAFIVDVPAPAPIPAAPTGLRIVASLAPPKPIESPNFTKATAPGVGSITDAKFVVWTLGPKDPLVEGGVEFTILHDKTREGGAATYLCYFNHLVYAWSVGNWYQQSGLGFQLSPIVPTGC